MEKLFDAKQWELLKMLPLNLLFYVGYADGKLDEDELIILATLIERGPKDELFRDKFVRHLFGQVKSDLDGLLERTTEGELMSELATARDTLIMTFDEDKYQNIMNSMLLAISAIAAASGALHEFNEKNISADERVRIEELVELFEIDKSWHIQDLEY